MEIKAKLHSKGIFPKLILIDCIYIHSTVTNIKKTNMIILFPLPFTLFVMVHFKTFLTPFCMKADIAFFAHIFCVFSGRFCIDPVQLNLNCDSFYHNAHFLEMMHCHQVLFDVVHPF